MKKAFHPLDVDSTEIVRLYEIERWTLRRIAEMYDTNHHMIKKILINRGVVLTNGSRFKKPCSKETRQKIGEKSRGRKAWNKDLKMNPDMIRVYMTRRMRTSIDLSAYPDLDKLQFLVKLTSKHFEFLGCDDVIRKAFLDKFYSDPAFNAIYDKWAFEGFSKWWYPSIDHKIPKSKGGSFNLENLQFLTWFENRAKADMTQEEWDNFKQATKTSSVLFIEKILEKHDQSNF